MLYHSVRRYAKKSVVPIERRYHRRDPFTDRVKVLISSGTGGDGASIMSHEHCNEFAGPGGGNGGRGGSVFVQSTRAFSDLSHVKAMGSQLRAGDGRVGYHRVSHGRNGEDLTVEVPIGTQVIDVDTNEVVYDMDEDAVQVLLLEGGQGGKGNAAFANKRHHSPVESTRGLPGNTMLAQLELKSIADCGLIGLPNAGKSSLLAAVSTCKPKIAPYAFTTLHPWIGVVNDLYGNSCKIADLPGLIEGAYENRGLGHQFLRHAERTRVLCFVVDMTDSYTSNSRAKCPAPWEVVELLQQELEFYMPGLSERGVMVFANKMDQVTDAGGNSLADKLQELKERVSLPVFPVSAQVGLQCGLTHKDSGLQPAMKFLCDKVFSLKSEEEERRRIQRNQERYALEQRYHSKHRGTFGPPPSANRNNLLLRGGAAPSVASSSGGHKSLFDAVGAENLSLVDQQLGNFYGASGFGEEFESYDNLPSTGNLTQGRDVTLQGKYWTLTRKEGERLETEKWR